MQGVGDGPHVLDVDPVDLTDLVDEQGEVVVVGQVDDELVDGTAGAPLEDVDPDDVGPDGADPAGDLTEGAGPVGQPDADDVGAHGPERYGSDVNGPFHEVDGSGNRERS